jgi:CMP-N-acetylneuraminic acid synthetase
VRASLPLAERLRPAPPLSVIMLKKAIQIPIKARSSTRIPNKNFTPLCGKPLAYWLLDEVEMGLPADWACFIDSESESVMEKLRPSHAEKFGFHKRDAWYASDAANGNHLLQQFVAAHPHYDIYVQLYITAVTLPWHIIAEAVENLEANLSTYDSTFLATEETGWIWHRGRAVNYDPNVPDGLPRSQDAMFLSETTGMYAIEKVAVLRRACRIGERPLPYVIPREFAVDIDTLEDLTTASNILHGRINDAT